jgi:uncharacterized protein (DUF849 family)
MTGSENHLEATRDIVFRNTVKDIEYILAAYYGNGTRFEFDTASSSQCSASSAASGPIPSTSPT